MKTAYYYSVIRFVPSRERQESINIGIFAVSPQKGKFYFQMSDDESRASMLLPPRANIRIYRDARDATKRRLQSIQQLADQSQPNEKLAMETFNDVIRPRESMIQYSSPGVIVGANEVEMQKQLLQRFV